MWFVLIFVFCWLVFCIWIVQFVAGKLERFVRHPVTRGLMVLGTAMFAYLLPPAIVIGLLFLPFSSTYIARLPPAFEVAEVIEVERGSMCDMAAFRYSEATHRAITEGGLSWLNASPQTGLSRERAQGYGRWTPTPHPDSAQNRVRMWLAGTACLNDHEDLDQDLDRALREPGSYYTYHQAPQRTGLLLIPSRKLIVYIHVE